jgi:hypothetical protein
MTPTDQAQKEIQEILEKYKLKLNFEFSFPEYKEVPEAAKLALLITQKHHMKIAISLVDS